MIKIKDYDQSELMNKVEILNRLTVGWDVDAIVPCDSYCV